MFFNTHCKTYTQERAYYSMQHVVSSCCHYLSKPCSTQERVAAKERYGDGSGLDETTFEPDEEVQMAEAKVGVGLQLFADLLLCCMMC